MKNAELRIVEASGTAAPLVPPSPRRRTLLLSPHNTATYTVGLNDHVALGAGITVTPTGGVVRLDFEDYGSFIQQELWVIASATADIGVLEGVVVDEAAPQSLAPRRATGPRLGSGGRGHANGRSREETRTAPHRSTMTRTKHRLPMADSGLTNDNGDPLMLLTAKPIVTGESEPAALVTHRKMRTEGVSASAERSITPAATGTTRQPRPAFDAGLAQRAIAAANLPGEHNKPKATHVRRRASKRCRDT